jgi:hypothetical protein
MFSENFSQFIIFFSLNLSRLKCFLSAIYQQSRNWSLVVTTRVNSSVMLNLIVPDVPLPDRTADAETKV